MLRLKFELIQYIRNPSVTHDNDKGLKFETNVNETVKFKYL